ncbi:type IV pilus modification PilV family protein [Glaciecola sp. 1036]|uniref:type IV pilus modification PilV family protein n=1 Tax=Alteromonadaceae TaxID=72275 RepID=UPI003D060BAF
MLVNRGLNLCNKHKGFTLVEMIVGMVIFAVSMVVLVSVFMPQAKRGIDPIWQTRAVMLGQSLLNEINAKAFDHNSDFLGSNQRCNEGTSCTTSGALGADGEARSDFNDIDDYNNLTLNASDIVGILGESIEFQGRDVYTGFQAQVQVFYDANQDGVNDDDINGDGVLDSGALVANRKLIRVTIITPDDERILFSSYRDNY